MRLGIAIPLQAVGLRESIDVAVEAEAVGYDDAWSSEVDGADGFSPLAAIAARTTRMRVGVALAPAFTRPPALLAMSAAGLHTLSDGRFALGIGSSSPVIVGRWMGRTYERPLTRVRQTVEALRQIFSGEKTTYAGDGFAVHGFRLGLGPVDVPILVGALGPRMYGLAGEAGDGILTTFVTPEALPALLADFRAGALAAGRDPDAIEVWSRLAVAVDEDTRDLRAMLRRFIAAYATVPAYNALLARQGFRDEAARMLRAWEQGRRAEAGEAVSDELLRALMAFGSVEDCLRRVEAYRRAGVSTLVIDAVSAHPDPDERRRRVRATLAAVAGAVTTPRLR